MHAAISYYFTQLKSEMSYVVPGGGGGLLQGIFGGDVPPGSSNPDSISDQKISLSTPVFRPGARFSKVPIINGPGKLSPFISKIEVSKVLHLA